LWALCLALLVISAVLDPSHNVTWVMVAALFPVLFGFLLALTFLRQRTAQSP
jgi:hypothetical protein